MPKKLYNLGAAFLLATSVVATPLAMTFAHAEDNTENEGPDEDTKAREDEIKDDVDEFKTSAESRKLAVLKDLCEKMIDHRKNELDKVKSRAEETKLTEEQKQEIDDLIDSQKQNLDAAKEDCDSGTTTDAVRSMVRDVQTKRRTFSSILPKLHALVFVRHADAFVGRLNNSVAELESKIGKAEDLGCDTTVMNASLADYKSAIESAKAHLATAKDLVAQIKESQDAGTLRDQLKTEMKAMVDALHDARDAHKAIIAALKECRKSTTEPSTTTPTTTQ